MGFHLGNHFIHIMLQNDQPGHPVVFIHMTHQNRKLLIVEGIEGYRHRADFFCGPAAHCGAICVHFFIVHVQIVKNSLRFISPEHS